MLDTNWLIDTIENLEREIGEHRQAITLSCPEHCWCWDLENAHAYMERALCKEAQEKEE